MIFFTLSLILMCIGVIGFILAANYSKCSNAHIAICGTLFYVGLIIVLCWVIDRDINPTAMDVYRGKATIAITYEDGVPVDSTVIFKKKK